MSIYAQGKSFVAANQPQGGQVSVATHVRGLEGQPLSPEQRVKLIENIPLVTTDDIKSMPDERQAGGIFRGTLTSGEQVVFIPLAWTKWETPRLITIYAEISRYVNIQRLFGVFHDSSCRYSVMEDIEGESSLFIVLKDALTNGMLAKASRIERLRLCNEIALSVAYLHSLKIVVKVISDSSVFVREVNGDFIPVMANLEHARLVFQVLHHN